MVENRYTVFSGADFLRPPLQSGYMDKGRLYPRSRILSTLTAGNHSSVLCVYYFRACGQRRGGARQSGIPSDAVFRLRLPAQGLAIRSGQRPPEQPEADGGDPGQQRGRTEHRAVGRPVRAAERLVRAAAHRQGAGRVLSALLPCAVSGNDVNISPGRRFMIDLLVGSLMADGGLESALHAAITAEIQDIEAKKEAQKEKEIDEQEANASTFHRSRTPLDKDLINTGICESSGKQCLPLVQLIQQLLSRAVSLQGT
ncbi:uncharacterized protein LOC100424132 isoform X4 [Macaca mulatta]